MDLSTLNDSQREAAMHMDGPMLVLAGAGTGKTRTLIYRLANMVDHGIPASTILLLTFTNKAAGEMSARAKKLVPEEKLTGLTACTYHSFCAAMLRKYGTAAGIRPDFSILSGPEDNDVYDMAVTALGFGKIRQFPNKQKIAGLISKAINTGRPLEELVEEDMRASAFVDEIGKVRDWAKKYKEEKNLYNYDDLLVAFYGLLKNYPRVAALLSDTYRYIMVDEYQDTNHLQDDILDLLCCQHDNLAVVGDDAQSLYGFRGSSPESIIHFPERHPGCKVVKILRNYRSNQEILNVANHVLTHATEGIYKELIGTHTTGAKPLLVHTPDQPGEAEYIVKHLPDDLKEACVLCRYGNGSYLLEAALQKAKIPFRKFGGPKFFDRAVIGDLLAYLRVLSNKRDEIAWYRILQVHRGIGKYYGRQLAASFSQGVPLTSMEFFSAPYFHELHLLDTALEEAGNLPFPESLKYISSFYFTRREENIKTMKVKQERNRQQYLDEWEEDKNDADILTELAAPYTDMVKFLDDLALDSTAPETGEGLTISTIHSAKGLEFNTVFILDCIDQIFPSTSIRDAGSPADNEELRCMYVAVTRAKRYLTLLCPDFATKWGRTIYGNLSHFITDDKLFRKEDERVFRKKK